MTDVDSLDWKDPTPEQMCKTVLDKVCDGSIVLMHNGAKNTPAALPSIIEGIQAKGYEIVVLMHNGAKNTPAALPSIIEGIQAKGYEIVLIKDLIPEGEYYTDVQREFHLTEN